MMERATTLALSGRLMSLFCVYCGHLTFDLTVQINYVTAGKVVKDTWAKTSAASATFLAHSLLPGVTVGVCEHLFVARDRPN